ncbi:BamA/TamA family outer membrane protein [Thiotrichales bacterium 19S9-12]|nr:BamA/TamA family outer membrane protein [Thiotrichales bacterium 19S9-11]MCF6811993.1 BamA/TamA family outer membrane protein [Thiotrichales bacterium 19S9-12]
MKIKYWIIFFILFVTSSISLANNQPKDIDVTIQGVTNKAILDHITDSLSVIRYKSYALENVNHLRLFYNSIPDEIESALINYGYFSPEIKMSLDESQSTWLIDINIKTNQQTKIHRILLKTTPSKNKLNEALLKTLSLKEGDPLLQKNYLASKSQLLTLVNGKGYLDAVLDESKILIKKSSNEAEVVFHLKLGKRYRYGEITVTQKQYIFNPLFINKYITLQKGQLFDNKQITKTQQQLDNSGYFASVSVTPDIRKRDTHNGSVPLRVELVAKESQSYSVGVGYGTFTGPRLTLGASYPHLSPDGHNAQVQLQLSSINTSFLTQYLIPGSDPVHTFWSINAQQSLYDLIPYQSLETLIGINYIDRLTQHISVNLGLHEYIIRYKTSFDNSNHSTNYLVPSINVSFNLRQPDSFFDNGLMFSNLTQAAPEIDSFSDQSFIRNLSTLRIALPIKANWTRFVSSYNFGSLYSNDTDTLAPEFRFYAGGIGTLLGYAYLSQGPYINGSLAGGRYLLTASAGVEQRIKGNFSTIIYYNIGNAFNNFNDVNPLRAAGLGLSWRSPLGPIIGYLTRTLNSEKNEWRFDFSIGAYF